MSPEILEITLFVESYEDLERQCAEIYRKTGKVVEKAVMPITRDFCWPEAEGISIIQINMLTGPVKVELYRRAIRRVSDGE